MKSLLSFNTDVDQRGHRGGRDVFREGANKVAFLTKQSGTIKMTSETKKSSKVVYFV